MNRITKELEVNDVLVSTINGVRTLVKGFREEETRNGKTTTIILEDLNINKGAIYFAPLTRIMHSHFNVEGADRKFYPERED